MASSPSKYGLLGRFNPEDLYNAFVGMEERQQIISVSVVVVVLLVLLFWPITCASSRLSKLEADLNKAKKMGTTLGDQISSYQSAKNDLEAMRSHMAEGPGGSLNTVIENIAKDVGLGANIDKLNPFSSAGDYFDEEGVDGTISKVTLNQVTDFLQRVEGYTALPLKVKKFQLKARYGKRDELTMTFQVSTIRLKKEPS